MPSLWPPTASTSLPTQSRLMPYAQRSTGSHNSGVVSAAFSLAACLVGRDSAQYLVVLTGTTLHDPFLHPPVATVQAAFTAHGDRLSGHLPSCPSSRPWRGCPRLHMREGRPLRHLSSGGPSPWARLARAPTTMATLTADTDLGGFRTAFPSLLSRSPGHPVSALPCAH